MELESIVEAILFVYAEPLSVEKLVKITKRNKADVEQALKALEGLYKGRGLTLLKKDGMHQLGSSSEHAKYIEDLVKGEFSEELSRAGVETLAVIAYKGPITRVDIEFLRGVNSSFTIRNLLMRGLVERVDNPKDARSYLYRISFDFLKHFGLSAIEELPQFAEFKNSKIDLPEEIKKEPESPAEAAS